MKRFFTTVLGLAVLFMAAGAVVQNVGARYKSDQKALELIEKARQAMGGDAAIRNVRSMRITGQTTHQTSDSPIIGETEIALQFPDKLSRTIKMGKIDETNAAHDVLVSSNVQVVVTGDKVSGSGSGEAKTFVFKKGDGSVETIGEEGAKNFLRVLPKGEGGENVVVIRKDGTSERVAAAEVEKIVAEARSGDKTTYTLKGDGQAVGGTERKILLEHAPGGMAFKTGVRDNEMLRLTLSLLMTAPEGMDVNYTFGGERVVDGVACNIVVAEFGGTSYKIYLGQASNLPVMLSYTGVKRPKVMRLKASDNPEGLAAAEVREARVLAKTLPLPEAAEITVKFSDYRSVDGVQLPFRWTESVAGAQEETFDVTAYELNPANIAEKFNNQRVFVRSK